MKVFIEKSKNGFYKDRTWTALARVGGRLLQPFLDVIAGCIVCRRCHCSCTIYQTLFKRHVRWNPKRRKMAAPNMSSQQLILSHNKFDHIRVISRSLWSTMMYLWLSYTIVEPRSRAFVFYTRNDKKPNGYNRIRVKYYARVDLYSFCILFSFTDIWGYSFRLSITTTIVWSIFASIGTYEKRGFIKWKLLYR